MELRTDRFKLKELFPDKTKKYAQELHKKAGDIEFIRKGIPIDPKDIGIKEGERAAIRLVTTPHLDRDGEILIPSGAILDDFRQSPSVLYGHDYKSLPVGSDQWIKQTKEGILAKTVYAKHQFAEDVYQCVKGKHLNSNSVGFIPVEAVSREDDKKAFAEYQDILEKDYGIDMEESGKAKAIYTKWILLEHSDVPVASNAQSLNLAVGKGEVVIKSDRLKKDLEIEVVKDKDIEIEFEVIKGKEIEVIKDKNDKKEKEGKGEKAAEAGAEEETKATITKPEKVEKSYPIAEEEAAMLAEEKQEKFNCECIKCGHKLTSEEHCDKIKCPECGGDMRRASRPGPGKVYDSKEILFKPNDMGEVTLKIMDIPEFKEYMETLQSQVTELKEGRVLSTKNRTMVKDTIDALTVLKERLDDLYAATEPTIREEERAAEIVVEKSLIVEKDGGKGEIDDKLATAVEKVLNGDNLAELISKALNEAVDIKIKKKLGRVE